MERMPAALALEFPLDPLLKASAGVALANAGYVKEALTLYEELDETGTLGDEVLPERAGLAMALGKNESARSSLKAYVAVRQDARAGVLKSRRYQPKPD